MTQVALEMANYSFVRNYVVKAESALEALNAPAAGAKAKQPVVALPGMVAPAADPIEVAKEKERQSTHERLTVAQGVASLGTGSFERAARAFTGIGKEALESKEGHVSCTSFPFAHSTPMREFKRAPRLTNLGARSSSLPPISLSTPLSLDSPPSTATSLRRGCSRTPTFVPCSTRSLTSATSFALFKATTSRRACVAWSSIL